MSADTFVDTNILIYAHDRDAGERHTRARECIRGLWEAGGGILSTQVLQELYVNLTRKIPAPLSLAEARELVADYLTWQVEVNPPESVLQASRLQEQHRLSFWDALIVSAAVRAGARRLLSEDLNQGQVIEGVRIENPLMA